jgi:hypothetical protein
VQRLQAALSRAGALALAAQAQHCAEQAVVRIHLCVEARALRGRRALALARDLAVQAGVRVRAVLVVGAARVVGDHAGGAGAGGAVVGAVVIVVAVCCDGGGCSRTAAPLGAPVACSA